ncbi:hypothetical protein SAMN04487905_12132 [Actinopolyspora xinjiangensis]|uniref:Uncharacterized protein n=1 Tax=Actinopolyspora xinjiangensis TaxID=405564 RepID=A0A1H0X1B0_9ACTN|nr:hypothetical protein [Actinopolyspora xinjiangensis]SDP96738.1 hypothetical protein SAMN04487905_12132 [Actinopolyspora xinjiangensis]
MRSTLLIHPDDRYDRDHASDSESRFGAYLRRNTAAFLDGEEPTEDPVEFAASAWRIARPPVMTPGYLVAHDRVLDATLLREEDGTTAIRVDLATKLPSEIVRGLRSRGSGWISGPTQVTNILRLDIPVPTDRLPEPAYSPLAVPVTETAKEALEQLCGLVNSALGGALVDLVRTEAA